MVAKHLLIGVFALGVTLTAGLPGPAQEKQGALGFFDPTAAPEMPPPLPDRSKVVTGIPVVQAKDAPVVVPADNGFSAVDSPFTGRVTVRADVGDGVGYARGYTYLEAMLPIQQTNESLLFADLRLVNYDHENRWEYNIGGGYRWCSPRLEHVLGVNAFYDGRKTDSHYYQQIGLGFEVLGRNLELRGNGYIIVGAAHRVIGDTGFANVGIAGNNFVFLSAQTTEVAMGGMEIEAGGRLPFFERFAPRGYVGFYTYSAEGLEPANGVRGRLEAQLTERVSLHFAIQHDQIFHTTVTGGLAVHFGAPAYQRGTGRASWNDVLHQRVVRDVNVVITQTTTPTPALVPVPPPPPPPPPPPSEELGLKELYKSLPDR